MRLVGPGYLESKIRQRQKEISNQLKELETVGNPERQRHHDQVLIVQGLASSKNQRWSDTKLVALVSTDIKPCANSKQARGGA